MKIKEAIQILEQFKQIAGEDADCDIERLNLVGQAHADYGPNEYGLSRKKVEYKVGYTVGVSIRLRDVALAPGDSGIVSSTHQTF